MDLATDTATACASLPDVTHLLFSAKRLSKTLVNATWRNGIPDASLHDEASDTRYTAQPYGTTEAKDKAPAFPRLLAAFEAAVEQVATPAQKKKMQGTVYHYHHTHFLGDMSQQQLRTLKLALRADVEAIIATARRNATHDCVPNRFAGAPLLLLPASPTSTPTDDARKALDALHEEAQEELKALKRRIEALGRADEVLNRIDAGVAAADAFVAAAAAAASDADADVVFFFGDAAKKNEEEEEEQQQHDANNNNKKRAKH